MAGNQVAESKIQGALAQAFGGDDFFALAEFYKEIGANAMKVLQAKYNIDMLFILGRNGQKCGGPKLNNTV